MKRATLILLLALPILALADDAGKFKLIQTTLVLPPDAGSQTFSVLVEASGLPLKPNPVVTPSLADANTPASPPVQVTSTFVSTSHAGAADQLLQFQVKVAGFPQGESQGRIFTISYGDIHETLSYTLTNLNGKTFAWSVKAPAEWNLGSMNALPIAIHTGDLPATGVSLYQGDLVSDDKQKVTIGKQNFQLCSNQPPAGCIAPDSVFAAHSAINLYLRPVGSFPFGTLKGNLGIMATEKTDPDVFALTIYSPNPYGIPLGFLCLFAGVLISTLLQFGLRSFTRNREERQITLLMRKRLIDLQAEFKKLPANLQNAARHWTDSAQRLASDLSDAQMKQYMRPSIPQAMESEITDLQTFKQRIEELGASFTFLRTLLRNGLEIVADWQATHSGHAAQMEDAAQSIATIAPAPDASAEINKILADLRKNIGEEFHARLAGARPRNIDDEIHSVSFQLLAANIVAIVFWAAVSVITGALLFIFQSPAFGTNFDLLLCVAWGLGISVAGGQSPQTTPSTVAGSIGMKIPGAPAAGDAAK